MIDKLQAKLQAVSNQLEDIEIEVYSLDDELEERDYSEIEIDSIMTSLNIVIASVTSLRDAIEKETLLIKSNENLRNLYAEYTTVRDLIGSEK